MEDHVEALSTTLQNFRDTLLEISRALKEIDTEKGIELSTILDSQLESLKVDIMHLQVSYQENINDLKTIQNFQEVEIETLKYEVQELKRYFRFFRTLTGIK